MKRLGPVLTAALAVVATLTLVVYPEHALSMGLAAGYPMDAVITARFRKQGMCTRVEGTVVTHWGPLVHGGRG